MEVSFDRVDGRLTITVSGRLDTSTAPQLEKDVSAQLTDDVTNAVFDFDNLEYISSAGLRIVIMTVQRLNGQVKVRNVNDEVLEVFEITGLTKVLGIN